MLQVTSSSLLLLFYCKPLAPTYIYTLSLHDALPILLLLQRGHADRAAHGCRGAHSHRGAADGRRPAHRRMVPHRRAHPPPRSEEHTSELQSPDHLVCRLLLEKKKRHRTVPVTLFILH